MKPKTKRLTLQEQEVVAAVIDNAIRELRAGHVSGKPTRRWRRRWDKDVIRQIMQWRDIKRKLCL
jgi:hypothetical protein